MEGFCCVFSSLWSIGWGQALGLLGKVRGITVMLYTNRKDRSVPVSWQETKCERTLCLPSIVFPCVLKHPVVEKISVNVFPLPTRGGLPACPENSCHCRCSTLKTGIVYVVCVTLPVIDMYTYVFVCWHAFGFAYFAFLLPESVYSHSQMCVSVSLCAATIV